VKAHFQFTHQEVEELIHTKLTDVHKVNVKGKWVNGTELRRGYHADNPVKFYTEIDGEQYHIENLTAEFETA